MKKQVLGTIVILLGFVQLTIAQLSPKEIKANKYFEKYDYEKAILKYNGIDSLSIESTRNLAESYRLLYDTENAEINYAKVVNSDEVKTDDYYYYAYVLKENSKYTESNHWMDKFKSVSENDLRVKHYDDEQSSFAEMLIDKGQFNIHNLDMNIEQEDFGPTFYKNQIVFASSREGKKILKRKWNWNQLAFLDLYVGDTKEDGQLENIKSFSKLTNKKYHEGPACFAKNGEYMAFTRNSYTGQSSDGIIKFQIFFSQLEYDEEGNENWSKPESFYLNNEEYSVGHPSMTEDGNTMYFASDMPGGYGLSDIYKVVKKEDGSWGEPLNLGVYINSEGNDMFPFYDEEEQMVFFASDGHVGLGGLDLYISPETTGGVYKKVYDLGVPINSSKDDFALIIRGKQGYFSSNREGGKGDDDIYSFKQLTPFVFGKVIKGQALDKEGLIIPFTKIDFIEGDDTLKTVTTDSLGRYEFVITPGPELTLISEKEDFFPGTNTINTVSDKDTIVADVVMLQDPKLSLYAKVTDKDTKAAIENVTFNMKNNLTGETEVVQLSSNADKMWQLIDNKLNDKLSYDIEISAPGYLSKKVTYNQTLTNPGQYNMHQTLDMSLKRIIAGETKLEDLISINPIYFDLNKHFIRPDAKVELDKIVKVMNENPTMVVELGSHTDCRASKKYNESLSDRRAKSSAKYISEHISGPERIYGKGYGEVLLLNSCACEGSLKSSCSEDEHQINRRTEFKIIKFDAPNTKVINNSPDSFDR